MSGGPDSWVLRKEKAGGGECGTPGAEGGEGRGPALLGRRGGEAGCPESCVLTEKVTEPKLLDP